MSISPSLMNHYARRITTPFHGAAGRYGSPVPHAFVVRSDSVAYGIGYASQVLEQDGQTDLAWRALTDAADETEQQLKEYGWMFTAEEAEQLEGAISEIRQLSIAEAQSAIPKEVSAPV